MKQRMRKGALRAAAVAAAGLAAAQSASAAVVAYYDFNNGTPGAAAATVPDVSGGGHTGTGTGTTYTAGGAPIAGGSGTAVQIGGGSNRIDLALAGSTSFNQLATQNAGTVAFWQLGGAANQTNFSLGNNTTVTDGQGRQFQAHVPWSDNNVYFDTGGTQGDCCGGTHRINKGLPGDYDTSAWHHWAFTKDSAGNKAIYLDGTLFHSGVNTAPLLTIDAATIGNNFGAGATEGYTGQLDDFIVFDNALTQSDVQTLRNQGGGAFVPEPAGLGVLAAVGGLGLLRRRRGPA